MHSLTQITDTPSLQVQLVVPMLLGVVVSFLTELVTKANLAPGLKATVTVVLSALAGAVSTVVYDPSQPWTAYALAIFSTLASALATHYLGATKVVQVATASVGIGPAGTQHVIESDTDQEDDPEDGPTVD